MPLYVYSDGTTVKQPDVRLEALGKPYIVVYEDMSGFYIHDLITSLFGNSIRVRDKMWSRIVDYIHECIWDEQQDGIS